MRKILTICFCLMLAGCFEKEIETEVNFVSSGTENVSCTYTGFCYGCGIGFDGKFSCGFSFNSNCSGSQKATVEYYQRKYYLETKPTEIRTENYSKVVKTSTCG